jgi:hypothetical protein
LRVWRLCAPDGLLWRQTRALLVASPAFAGCFLM